MNRAILSVVVVVLAAYATAAVVPSVDRMLGAELAPLFLLALAFGVYQLLPDAR